MISVCIATYNGENYIEKQLKSILSELSQNDEIIIVDDCSVDNSVKVIENIKDSRIRLFHNNTNQGHVKSFSKAIQLSTGDYIFMSDQDDIWIEGRVSLFIEKLQSKENLLVTSNFVWIDQSDNLIHIPFSGVLSKNSSTHLINILDIFLGKTNYFGCAMAFNKNIIPIVVPIPEIVESHDLWIALIGNIMKKNIHIDAVTLLKRKHLNNTTTTKSTRTILKKFNSRIIFLINIFQIYSRLRK